MKKEEYKNMENLDQTHWWFLGVTSIILSVLNRYYKGSKDLEILDAGSGTCWLSLSLMEYGKVTALDIEESVLGICRKRGVSEVILADVQDMPIKDNKFDIIVCSEVLYHLYVADDAKAMNEFYRILKPGGRLLVKVPAHSYLSASHDKANLTRKRYEKHEVRDLYIKSGFEIDFLSYANFLLFPIVYTKRMIENLFNKGGGEDKSDIRKTWGPVNFILLSILRFEGWLLSKTALPQGSSILCVGRKEND